MNYVQRIDVQGLLTKEALKDDERFVPVYPILYESDISDLSTNTTPDLQLSQDSFDVLSWEFIRIEDAKVKETLLYALMSDKYLVRSNAAKALGQLGDSTTVSSLIDALGEFDVCDTESLVNKSASAALIKIGDVAILPLIDALNKEDNSKTEERNGWRRFWIMQTLGKLIF